VSTEALAERLIEAHRRSTMIEWMPALAPSGIEGAYRVQDAVLRALDGNRRPTAWKVSPARPKAEPLASPVPATGVHDSPARMPPAGGVSLGIEAEIAFRLGTHGAIEAVCVLIELCATRYSNWNAADPLSRLADFQSHGAFIVGSGIPDWRQLDFHAQAVELRVEGAIVKHGIGTHPTGDLVAMLAWASQHCEGRGWPLAVGDIVTMGSWTGITALAPGQEAVARFPGIGEARLALAR